MAGPSVDIPLPLYRSNDTVRAAWISEVTTDGQVCVDFPRYGDDVPIYKAYSGKIPSIGDVYVEPGQTMTAAEFARKYSPAANDAPREPMGVVASFARVAYEAARANQGGKGESWDKADETTRMAATALTRHLLDNPFATHTEAHEKWRSIVTSVPGPHDPAASVAWDKLTPERQAGMKVFRAVVAALK